MPWRVFYSYSHRDAEFRERLGTYLAPLKHQGKIVEWYDRKIEPGTDWEAEISVQLDTANVIFLLVSEDFLASDYCFGVEVERSFARLKRGEAMVVPILLKPCLWQESRLSELQIIPRDAKAITSWPSQEDGFANVATEIRELVSAPPPSPPVASKGPSGARQFDSALDLVRCQVGAYTRLYERTRQRMPGSYQRTARMQQIVDSMRAIATASYPLLDELANSPSPGDHLAAVAILQVFVSEDYLPFLVRLVGSEKPFVGYQAAKALQFAVSALDIRAHQDLLQAIVNAQATLQTASPGLDSGRLSVLRAAEQDLRAAISALAAPSQIYD